MDWLDEIEERITRATDGPWVNGERGIYYLHHCIDERAYYHPIQNTEDDDIFIANIHEDINRLIAEVRRLREEKEALKIFYEAERKNAADWWTDYCDLKEEVEELRQDKLRLDWIIKYPDVYFDSSWLLGAFFRRSEYKSIREAISSEMVLPMLPENEKSIT